MIENKITQQIENYIFYKRNLGYKIAVEAQELRRFANYTRDIGYEGSLTADIAIQWASLDPNYSRWYMARRLETVHTFALYAASFDSNAQIPQTGYFGKCHGRVTPYIYSEKEILLLMKQAENLYSSDVIRRMTVTTALGLLWATGLRVSELTCLTVKDVHYDEGYIFINNTKFKKDRLIFLHPSVSEKLSLYSQLLEKKLLKRSPEDFFFVTTSGRRFNTPAFEYAFRHIRNCLLASNQSGWTGRRPRLYDIRHSFACRTIQRWLESGEDANQKIYLLSVYMGHVKPEDTYWYLTATPELLGIACNKFELHCGKEEWLND